MVHASLSFLATVSVAVSLQAVAGLYPLESRQMTRLLGNTSVLPPGWSGNSQCTADCGFGDLPLIYEMMFGPNFTDATGLTIESCVAFCDQQGSRMAGLKGTKCRCSNIYNPSTCFESDPGECSDSGLEGGGCPGNPLEGCGSENNAPPLYNVFFNLKSQFSCSDPVWPGGAPLTPSGSWRFSYFYNDSFSARALPHSAINTPSPVPHGSLTVEACVTACENSGFSIAGVEFGAECFCGNALESNSQPITDCSLIPTYSFPRNPNSILMPCTGNSAEYCGGPGLISIYTLPGTGLVPMIPFDPALDNFCRGDCIGHF